MNQPRDRVDLFVGKLVASEMRRRGCGEDELAPLATDAMELALQAFAEGRASVHERTTVPGRGKVSGVWELPGEALTPVFEADPFDIRESRKR